MLESALLDSVELASSVASEADAPPAARVREAGCVLIGKTTMPDYGMLVSGVSSLHGITRNPWNLARNPAGSSSGAGAGMAAGYAPLALGTDIAGSVRLPAAYTGVFALKPSLGRVPIYPPFLGRVVGPITRTVMDAALLMTVLTRPDRRDYMALPYQEIDWPASLDADLRVGRRVALPVTLNNLNVDFTNDIRRALTVAERLDFGIIGVNDINPTSASVPFGGIKESGLGREGAHEGLLEYLDQKVVGIAL